MNELFRVIGEPHVIQGKNEAAYNKKTTQMIEVCTFTVFGICAQEFIIPVVHVVFLESR